MAKGIAGRTQGIHQADGGFQTNTGVVSVTEERVLTYSDGAAAAAGVYTMVPVDIPAGATITDIRVQAIAVWNAGTSAALIVGDTADPNGFYDAVNLKATDLTANQILGFHNMAEHGKTGAYLDASALRNCYRAAATQVTAEVTTVGTMATTGQTRILVTYVCPVDFVKTSTFVAS